MKQMLLAAFMLSSGYMFAQKQITVEEAPRPMSKDTQPSFLVEIPQTTLKGIEKNWLKYVSSGSKVKATVVNGENIQAGAVNTNISTTPFFIYSKLLETTEGVRITVWISENDTVFISKELNNDKDLAAQKFVRDFAVTEYQNVVKKELETEQDKQKALEKELDGLIKAEEKSGKKISGNQRSIQRANDAIATGNADIQTVSYKINDAKRMVEKTASDANANKGAKQTLKDQENEKKKLQKQNENQAKDIDNWNKEIREEERSIDDLKQKQSIQKESIEKQKQKVQEVQTKLADIK